MARRFTRSALKEINDSLRSRREFERSVQNFELIVGKDYNGKLIRKADGEIAIYAGKYIVDITNSHMNRRLWPGDYVTYHVTGVEGNYATATAQRV